VIVQFKEMEAVCVKVGVFRQRSRLENDTRYGHSYVVAASRDI